MTPESSPEERASESEPSPTTRFGLLRTLLWSSPGFGAAALWVCLADPRSAMHGLDFRQRCWITGAAALLSVAAFAWLDALVNPAVKKRDGHPTAGAMWLSAAWFTGGQVVAMTPVFLTTVILAEMAGFRS